MKKHIRFSIILTAVMILSLVLAGGAAAKSNNKVDVCHNKGNGSFALLKVNANTLKNHLAHGDAAPGEAVPGQPGMVFAADCTLISTAQNGQTQSLTLPPTTNKGKKAAKVDVCHRRGNGTFILININLNALPAHIQHGDGLPNGEVPNQTGKYLTNTCSISNVPQKELVDTVTVKTDETALSNGVYVPVPTNIPLDADQKYEIKVSGTYIFDTVLNRADAEYSKFPDALTKGDTGYATPNLLDLSINDCTTNRDWGVYQPSHIYTMPWTGTGAPLTFCIKDTYYGDNVGTLTVEIWKVNW